LENITLRAIPSRSYETVCSQLQQNGSPYFIIEIPPIKDWHFVRRDIKSKAAELWIQTATHCTVSTNWNVMITYQSNFFPILNLAPLHEFLG
jgi:hypothetical protein